MVNRKYTFRFKVSGSFTFPLDMLRYDACFPGTQQDVADLDEAIRTRPRHGGPAAPFAVELTHYSEKAQWEPERGRWASFGWQVTECRRMG
jgi:hypothetical protein